MNDQMLAEVHAMLSAQFKATGMITIIDGWTLFQNSDAGPYVGLYNSRRNHREGRVYVQGFDGHGQSPEFRKLPKVLQDAVLASLAKEQPVEAPRAEGREAVEQKRYLRSCDPFKLIRYKYASASEDDKEPWRIERTFPIGRKAAQVPVTQVPAPQAQHRQATPEPTPDPARDGIVAELWTLFPAVYQNWKQEAEKIASGITIGRTKELKMLSIEELNKTRAIVLLDKLGKATYGDDWYAILGGMVEEADYDSVYTVSLDVLRAFYKPVYAASRVGAPA